MRAGTPIGATLLASMPTEGVCADAGGGRVTVTVTPPGRRLSEVFIPNVAQVGDVLRSLPDSCTPLVLFDPQFRELLNRQKYGNDSHGRASGALDATLDAIVDTEGAA